MAGAHESLADSSCVRKSLREELGKSHTSNHWGHLVVQTLGEHLLINCCNIINVELIKRFSVNLSCLWCTQLHKHHNWDRMWSHVTAKLYLYYKPATNGHKHGWGHAPTHWLLPCPLCSWEKFYFFFESNGGIKEWQWPLRDLGVPTFLWAFEAGSL